MKKGDKFVALVVLVLVVIVGMTYLMSRLSSDNLVLVVKQHGVELKRIALDETVNDEFRIDHDDHYNVVSIKNGVVKVIEANCKNQICVKTGAIRYAGEQIVCLPHQLIISIEGGQLKRDTVVN